MHKNTLINIVGVLVIIALAGLGIYLYQKTDKAEVSSSAAGVSVDSTGGTLTVSQTALNSAAPAAGAATVLSQRNSKPSSPTPKNMNKVSIDTSLGKIVLELYPKDAPKTVENFLTLVKKGFYNGLIFHRVISSFMIQGGDPLGTGTGGPGYQFADELDPNTASYKAGYKKGVLAMANAGPNTNGSQFFIMLADYPLPHAYTIFGHVISGQDVVDAIGRTPTGPNDRPITPVVMKNVTAME